MLITGSFGLGKTQVVKTTGEDIAVKDRQKEYCYLNNMPNEEKEKLITENTIKNYFIVMDMRLSEYDACLTGDMLISMSDGTKKPMELLKEGDEIIGEKDGKGVIAQVIKKWNKGTSKEGIVEIFLENGKKINATKNHYFLTNKGYKQTKDLNTSDILYMEICEEPFEDKKIEFKPIKIFRINHTNENRHIFDLTTSTSNYIVEGIVCHNSDIRGLPDFDKLRRWVEWKYPFFVEILSHPDSDGILFFDEFTLASDLTLKATYKILHDKLINDTKINYNWLIICAGNIDSDRSNITEIAPPIRDRVAEMELIPATPKEWIKWATKYGISPKIIAYLSWKGTSLRKVDLDKTNKYTTERSWERLNCFMNCPIDNIELVAGTCIGEDIASEFIGFLRIEGEIDLNELIKSPEKLRGITDAGKKYFVVSGLAEKYKENLMTFEQLFAVSTILDEIKSAEFVALLWRLSSRMNKIKFRKDFTTKELKHPLRAKFLKYLTEE